jgi:shikimate dehydrogenase
MDLYAVAGNPVEHSQSPFIHAAFARQTGQELRYGRLLCPLDDFEGALRRFVADRRDGREGQVRGCNVTVPFKMDAYRLARRHSERAHLAEAANVLRFDEHDDGEAGGWFADNSDGIGLVRDIETNAGAALAGSRVLLVGAGGAAAGALGPLLAARPALLVVANRTLDKADALVRRHVGVAGACALRAASLDDAGVNFDIVVNATATSLQGAAIPVAPGVLGEGALALDLMYGAAARPFLAWAEGHGARGRDGLGMLVEQAAEAFALWRGVRPDTAPVLAELRERLAAKR